MKLSIIIGTRPEILKMSPIIRECIKQDLDYFILHTGQHYSYEMDGVFFDQLELPKPKYNLGVGSGTPAEEVSRILLGVERIFLEEKPTIVLVEGDTFTAMASALVSAYCHVPVGHIEAGLRSYDMQMPEEINRVIVDHCSELLFAPTENARQILIGEGISQDKIFVTGNTIVDMLYQYLPVARKDYMPRALGLKPKEYILATMHRQENTDSPDRFGRILKGLDILGKELNLPVIYPIHPRSRKMIRLLAVNNIMMIEPLGFVNFLQLESNAKLVLTDSGGVQEESCVLGVPCVTLRDNTERPESIEVGANILSGTSVEGIIECAKIMIRKKKEWNNPFGDGKAGEKIINILRSEYE